MSSLEPRSELSAVNQPLHCLQHSDFRGTCQNCIRKKIASTTKHDYHYRWVSKNRERVNAYKRRWYARQPQKLLLEVRIRSIKLKVKALSLLGRKCARCGETDIRLLTINHLNGDGTRHRVTMGQESYFHGPRSLYMDIIYGRIDRKTLDLRCYNCNIMYEYERKRLTYPPTMPTDLTKFNVAQTGEVLY